MKFIAAPDRESNKGVALIVFLLSPVIAAGLALTKFRKKAWSKNIFWLFCIFFGYTFYVFSEGVDADRYAHWFIELSKVDISLPSFLSQFYTSQIKVSDQPYLDVLQPLLSFILSRFTTDPRILFATFALVFGYFYSRNIWFVLGQLGKKKNILIILFVLVFALIDPIWNINGFRFGTAVQVFLFGTLLFAYGNKNRGILFIFLTPLVHFSFIIPIAIFSLYLLIGNRVTILFIIFLATLAIDKIDYSPIKDNLMLLPEIFQEKPSLYLSEEMYQSQTQKSSKANWYISYYTNVLNWISIIFIFIVFIQGRGEIVKNVVLSKLFSLSLVFFSFANIANLMPQGGRFFMLAQMVSIFFIIQYLKLKPIKLVKVYKRLVIPFLLLIIIVSFRRGASFTGLTTIIGNPITAPFIKNDTPLIDLIK